jgi:N-glycosylase/DNA lyase
MKIKVQNFDLKNTVEGGQIFNYSHDGNFYFIVHSGNVIKIRQPKKNELEFFTYPQKNGEKFVKNLFNFNDEYLPVIRKYFKNKRILSSYENFSGVRITQLDPWECLIGFICSQMNNIPRIRQMVRCICKKTGKKIIVDGKEYYLFPKPSDLAKLPDTSLDECKLGYRKYYIIAAARAINSGFALDSLRKMDYSHAKKGLMVLPGIGEKVADCILVFSLGFQDGFPVDIWIKRIMQKLYFGSRDVPEKKIAEFARKKFGKDAAVVHEFLFANRKSLV